MLHSSLDDGNAPPPPPPSAASGSDPTSGVAAARALFQSKASRGQGVTSSTQKTSALQHSRAITGISIARGDQTMLTTSSLDGKIVLWDLQSTMLSIDASNLKLH